MNDKEKAKIKKESGTLKKESGTSKKESGSSKKDGNLPTLEEEGEKEEEGKKKKSKRKYKGDAKSEKMKHKKNKKEISETSSESKKRSYGSPLRKDKNDSFFHSGEVSLFNIPNISNCPKHQIVIPVCSRKTATTHDVGTNKAKISASTSHYVEEVSTQHPNLITKVPFLNQCPEFCPKMDKGDQTVTISYEQQTQAPSVQDARLETINYYKQCPKTCTAKDKSDQTRMISYEQQTQAPSVQDARLETLSYQKTYKPHHQLYECPKTCTAKDKSDQTRMISYEQQTQAPSVQDARLETVTYQKFNQKFNQKSNQKPHSLVNQCPKTCTAKNKGHQTVTISYEQQNQAPSSHDVQQETVNLIPPPAIYENEIAEPVFRCKYPIDPCQLIKKLVTLGDKKFRRDHLEVNDSCPFVHKPCQPCLDFEKKEERLNKKVISKQNSQNPPISFTFENIECSAFSKPVAVDKSSSPIRTPTSKIETKVVTKSTSPIEYDEKRTCFTYSDFTKSYSTQCQTPPCQVQMIPFQEQMIQFEDQKIPFQDQKIKFQDQKNLFQDQKIPFQDQKIPFQDQKIQYQDQKILFEDQKIPFQDQKIPFQDQKIPTQVQTISCEDQMIQSNVRTIPTQFQRISCQDQKISYQDQKISYQNQTNSPQNQMIYSQDQIRSQIQAIPTQVQTVSSHFQALPCQMCSNQVEMIQKQNQMIPTEVQTILSEDQRIQSKVRKIPTQFQGISSQFQTCPCETCLNQVQMSQNQVEMIQNQVQMIPNQVQTNLSQDQTIQSKVRKIPTKFQGISSQFQTSPCETCLNQVQMSQDQVQMIPYQVEMIPNQVQTKLSQDQTIQSKVRTIPTQFQGISSQFQTPPCQVIIPSRVEMVHSQVQTTPRQTQITPRQGQITPNQGQITPRQGQTTPRQVQTIQSHFQTTPQVQTPLCQIQRIQSQVPTIRSQVQTPPCQIQRIQSQVPTIRSQIQTSSKVKTSQSRLKTSPSRFKTIPTQVSTISSHIQAIHNPNQVWESRISYPQIEKKLIDVSSCGEGETHPCLGLKDSFKGSEADKPPILIKLLPRKKIYCCWGRRSSWELNSDKRPEGILGLTEVTHGTKIWKMLFAEFIGTFLLVLIGCGAILAIDGKPTIIEISMAFGLTIGSVVQIIGHISGGHINPAVTISFFIACEMKLLRALLYIVAQLLGAAAGAALLMVATPNDLEGDLGITGVNKVNVEQAFLYEVILTFFFVLVIHTVADSQRKDIRSSPAIIIGLAAAACHLSGIKFSGSSMNPARTFGPAVVTNNWENHWVYWAGPIIGASIAALLYKFLFKPKKSDDESYDF